MCVTESEPGRDRLGFREAVLRSFDFLRNYNMKVTQQESTFVRYESKNVFANVYHGRGSYVIGVEIGRHDRTEKYGLDYIVSHAGQEVLEKEGFGRSTMFQVSSCEGVQQFVPKVAELVEKYAVDFLRGDSFFYDQLAIENECRAVEYTKRQRVEQVRKKAESAWVRKDFAHVAELYQSIAANLTTTEAKRLEYAARHTSK